MKDAQKPDHVSLNTLIGRLREGRYVIPDSQREFEWLPSRFAARFDSKEAVATQWTQLAELRNGIRHSRAVSDIARKEGEAALLWYEQVLGR